MANRLAMMDRLAMDAPERDLSDGYIAFVSRYSILHTFCKHLEQTGLN